MADMHHERACFTSTVFDGAVFVYGGLSGNGEGDNRHVPVIAPGVIERFDPEINTWKILDIKGPQLACFGAVPSTSYGESFLILGGTNGEEMSDEIWEINC